MVDETPVQKEEDTEDTVNPMLAEARALAETILEGNKRHEELLNKQEKLLSEQALSGNLGGKVESKPHVETDEEYAERIEKEIAEGKHNDIRRE